MADLHTLRRNVDRIQTIAQSLIQLAALTFNEHEATLAAEREFDYMREGASRSPEFDNLVRSRVSALRNEYRARVSREGTDLVAEMTALSVQVAETVDAIRPHRDTTSPVAIMLSQEQWNAARQLLESGRSLPEVIKLADLDRLFAIEAFAPDYLHGESKIPHAGVEDERRALIQIRDTVRALVTTRLIEIASSDTAEALQLGHVATGWNRVALVWADYLQRLTLGSALADALVASITATAIAQEHGLIATPQEIRDAANATVSAAASEPFGRRTYEGARYLAV